MKTFTIKVILFILCIFVFACIYRKLFKGHIEDKELTTEAFYNSILTQTLTGSATQPPTLSIKKVVMIQSLIGFCFISGFILEFINYKLSTK